MMVMGDRVDSILNNDKGPRGLAEQVAKQMESSKAYFEYRKAKIALNGKYGRDSETSPAILSSEGKRELKKIMAENLQKMVKSDLQRVKRDV